MIGSSRQEQRALARTALFLCGAFLAVAILALTALSGRARIGELVGLRPSESRIAPGFLGMANFGQWRLICVPAPALLDGLSATGGPAPPVAPPKARNANACRVNQEMVAPQQDAGPGQVIVAANFSLVGPNQTPAAMLRLPVTARAGDMVGFRFDDGAMAQSKVRDCAATECLAAWTLTNSDWERLSTARSLQVTFPATGRQWVLLDLPVQGLAAAIAALKRAETS
jgi:invasion protein IalB